MSSDSTVLSTVPLDGPSARLYAEVTGMLARFNGALESETQDPQLNNEQTNVALRLALVAMTEAQKRIERQQARIAELECLSVTDELTGVMNRRGFDMHLGKAIAQSKRLDQGGVVLMIDLDRFKAVNDTHGHAAGDQLLQTVASVLTKDVRETDTVARLGGDEFAVLMPDLEASDGLRRADLLSDRLNTATLSWNNTVLCVSASVGAVRYETRDKPEDVMHRADEIMYAQKSARRGDGEIRMIAPKSAAPETDALSVREDDLQAAGLAVGQ